MLLEEDVGNISSDASSDYDPLSNLGKSETKGVSPNPFRALGDLNVENAKQLGAAFTNVAGNYQTLIEASQSLANSMGIGQARAVELKLTVADTVPELTKLGLSTKESFDAIKEAPVALGTNTTIASETIVELGATTKFTGLEVKELASTFKNAGFELGNVAETMADVANYAKSVGVNVLAVTELVSKNLQQLNLFNFENGVDGLAQMASKATMLGYDMGKVLSKADELLSPEKAIDFSASLQRLGVTSTELLDPLSAMDLAMNNPERLATEMEKVAKQFVQLKEDGSGFEIMPGAKLQLREVAQQMGMTAEELSQMAIRSSDLDMKMQQIRFPSFAASEEDKMLIANMAQMKDGRAVVQIEEGDEIEEVAVEDLTAEQLKELQKEQANQNKTAEELAVDQLNVLQKIAANTSGGIQAAQLGIASIGPMRRYLETINETRLAITKNTVGNFDSSEIREMGQSITQPLEDALKNFVKDPSIDNLTGMLPKFEASMSGIGDAGKKIIKATGQSFSDMGREWTAGIKKIYGEENVSDDSGTNFFENYRSKVNEQEKVEKLNQASNTTNTSNLNLNQNIDLTVKSDGSVDNEMLKQAFNTAELKTKLLELMSNDPSFMAELKKLLANYNNMDN